MLPGVAIPDLGADLAVFKIESQMSIYGTTLRGEEAFVTKDTAMFGWR